MKISELTKDQKGHLAWRLEHNTYCGYGTSCAIARGEAGDMEVYEAFMRADKSKRSALILARKVETFVVDEKKRDAAKIQHDIFVEYLMRIRGLDFSQQVQITEGLWRGIKGQLNTLKMLAEQFKDEETDPDHTPAENHAALA